MRALWSPPTNAAGLAIRRSPIPFTSPPRPGCALTTSANGSAVDAHSVLVRDLADYDARFGIDFTIGPHSTLDSGHKVVL